MRPPFSVSLEPGLDRGVPWGRDLFTFVTSATGHIMRTLQKPRKNRPSKRQVNHRRFLHNMIQRRFADIEAGNHRLASSLYSKNRDKDISTLLLDKPETPDSPGNQLHSECLLDPEKNGNHMDLYKLDQPGSTMSFDVNASKEQYHFKTSVFPDEQRRIRERKEKSHKGVEITSKTFQKGANLYQGLRPFQVEGSEENLSIDNFTEKTQTRIHESSFEQLEENTSPFFSSEFSPLSLDLCDLSILVSADKPASVPRNMADTTEGQLKDILNQLSVGNTNFGVSNDVENYFDSILGCQGDAEATEQSSFSEVDDVPCEGADYLSHYGYCSGDDHMCTTDFGRHAPQEDQTSLESADVAQSLTPTSDSLTHQQTANGLHQTLTACRLGNCPRKMNFTPFEGIAQSFSAPNYHHGNRPISTPPPEDDWLFTDILKDPNFTNF